MNRIQKFQAKWKKFEADRHAIANAKIENREETPGLDELQNQGGLKRAAAVFTEEGLQTFAQLFSNAVEQAIHNHLSQAVEAAVEKKMAEVFEIATAKLRMMTEQLGSGVWGSVASAQEGKYPQVEQPRQTQHIALVSQNFRPSKLEEEVSANSTNEIPRIQNTSDEFRKPVQPVVRQKKKDSIKEQSKIVAEYLRMNGRQRVCDLSKNVEGVFWSSNPWIKIAQFCDVNPHIRKYKGYYEYVEAEETMEQAPEQDKETNQQVYSAAPMNSFEGVGVLN